MKHFPTFVAICIATFLSTPAIAQDMQDYSPDGRLCVNLYLDNDGRPSYTVVYDGKELLSRSPLGLLTNIGDFTKNLSATGHVMTAIKQHYNPTRIKTSSVDYVANEVKWNLVNADNRPIDIVLRVSNNDIAIRYSLPKSDETGSVRVLSEATGFTFPEKTTTFLTSQSEAMIGWKRTKPSYEEVYHPDAPLSQRSDFGKGFTFPCLFHIGDDGWALVSETGVDSRYCASHLSDQVNGTFTIAFPMPEENNGNGTVEPAFALPGSTPWRTITVGSSLKPIVETTVTWDVVEPLYDAKTQFAAGKGTWSWILWQDGSINYDDQIKYIDLAKAMNFQYVLIDNWWDTNIGHERMEQLIQYAHSQGIDVFLWYSSSGYWNDIVQGPINLMDRALTRKREMSWLQKQGVKGIKVDFFGGDKQETIRLYEDILSDADDHGLMVIFHGCTLPRGWERMYPNYAGSEAVLASENLIFEQRFCDNEAFNACLHPFIRNTVGCMEFGGSFLNRHMNRDNNGGNLRKTTDAFELATAVLFQNPIQNFALAPNNLTDAPELCLNFLRNVPTLWDETRFIDGYPGKYVALMRRNGDKWYIAAINATAETVKIDIELPVDASTVELITDDKNGNPTQSTLKVKKGHVTLSVAPQGGAVIVQ